MKFKNFNQDDKLIKVEIEGYTYLIDTGSPISFAISDNLKSVIIDGNKYPLLDNPLLAEKTRKTIVSLTDDHIDAVIGTDIISETSLTIDYLNEEIYFFMKEIDYEDIGGYNIGLDFRFGYIYTKLFQNGKPMDLILDTGATIGYVKEEFVDMYRQGPSYVDYSLLGTIRGRTYEFKDGIHDDAMCVGIMPQIYEPYTDGIISVFEFCRPGYIRFDFKNKRISLSRRFL